MYLNLTKDRYYCPVVPVAVLVPVVVVVPVDIVTPVLVFTNPD